MSEISPHSPTLRCPTCGASQAWSDTCRRCRCDLSLLHGALRQVDRLRRRCLENLRDGRYDDAARAARRCCELDASADQRQLLAVAEFLRGRFEVAVRVARAETTSSRPRRRECSE
jgi:hypothetical protein